MSFFENYQNYRKNFFNSSFDSKFYTGNINTGHPFTKLTCEEIWCQMRIWRKLGSWHHISVTVGCTEKYPVLIFICVKFPIQWAIHEVSIIILKFFKNWIFNGSAKIKSALVLIKKSKFSKKFFTGFLIIDGSTDVAFTQTCYSNI